MKKYNVFKVLGIVVILSILLSYFIPQTTVSYGEISKGGLNPSSIIDTFSNGITAFNVFIAQFIFILVLAVFYKILSKTGKYDELVNNIAVKFNTNKGIFIVFSVLFFGLVTAIIGDVFPMLIFVPLFMAVTLKLGYKKVTAVASTIGAIILGSAGSLNTNIMNQILSTEVSTNILYKIIIALVGLVSLIAFILVFNKPAEKVKLEKINSKKQLPILISMILILVFVILGLTPWSDYFGYKGFQDLFTDITDFKLFKVSVYNAFVGSTLNAWGNWQIFDLSVLLVVFGVILLIIYKIKFNDFLELSANAIKKYLPYALIVVLANVVLVNVYSSGWFYTVINALSGSKFNMFAGSIMSALSAIVYPDYAYGVQFSLTTVIYSITKSKDFYDLLQIVYQSVYSLFLLVSPTSILLLLGIYFLNVSFQEWIKYIWKFFLILLATMITILSIIAYGFSIPVIVALIIIVGLCVFLTSKRINQSKLEMKSTKKETKKPEVKKEVKKEVKNTKKSTPKKSTKKTTKKK